MARTTKLTGKPRTRKPSLGTSPRKAPSQASVLDVGDIGKVEPMVGKKVDKILMVSVEDDRMRVVLNGKDGDFFVMADAPNYAAMVSTVLAAQASGAHLAVKYQELRMPQTGPRRALAMAKGVHAVIAGGSF